MLNMMKPTLSHSFPSLRNDRRRGLTLTEVLVALAVSMILIASMTAAFIQIMGSVEEAKSEMDANTAARSAVYQLGEELRVLDKETDLEVVDDTLGFGDKIDNDRDGFIDEEFPDAFDDDADFSDLHLTAGGATERLAFVGFGDLGDRGVDEDVLFSNDQISWLTMDANPQRITYRIDSFDGRDNVLIRSVITDIGLPTEDETIEPVIFEVMSFNVLVWNPNSNSNSPAGPDDYWAQSWNSAVKVPPLTPFNAPAGVPPFRMPAGFFIEIVVNADSRPLEEFNWQDPGVELKTISASTIVTVPLVTDDFRYFIYVRD